MQSQISKHLQKPAELDLHCLHRLLSSCFSDADSTYMDSLTEDEISLVAEIIGLPLEASETVDVKARKCSGALQYYLKPPRTRFSAFCFGTKRLIDLIRYIQNLILLVI